MRNGAVTSSCASGDVHGAANHTSVHTTSSNAAQDKQKSLGVQLLSWVVSMRTPELLALHVAARI